ncbi:hypothetical protein K437DRAFT_226171 [Tilletiaria anomala UBC 951]|uniref:RING-type domain-containing protein n=1 Tax=Tilletiaria anomala (strain ATCC 24038 / CBS 436.72 / UBC 951) TaxID=1037660 RepID=A0A066VLA6_TILAU|nr:uncharacterized protein K437DRAFT_226171 [Tilletiaria anomala UBC 951]KDN42522.1 hypothetical protein K437DRAFT_226171 [Tilletiaria anomala UBC 951]
MEDVLHCNRLECRKNLGSEAVVTTCSHIFCLTCANKYFTETRSCPACEASLDQPDDVVVSFLNPSADYRTSVLAGLAPGIVMEIASRSLSFWQYQCSQEAMFQRLVLKNAQERATTLEAQLRTTISEANNQLAVLQTKVNDLTQEVKGEKRVSYELREKLRSASKDYERLKVCG